MKKRVAVLGSTGSIGKSTLDIIRDQNDYFEPVLLTAHKNAAELEKLKQEFPGARFVLGEDGLLDAISSSCADITVNGISGAAGLIPSIAAIKAGSDLALANKETVVMAAPLVYALAKEKNINIIPVDSEHSAIFKLIEAHGRENVSEIILTASGGPFRNYPMEKLKTVSAKEALAHPTWNMGPKITIDSATMANKGLEVIEASALFGFPPDHIKVSIHPQSIVHSMVRLKNGAVYAQMSNPDMKLPIHDALTWPETRPSQSGITTYGSLDLESLSLSFEKPDMERFPMLGLAYRVLETANTTDPLLPVVYNAANEVAVEAFLGGKISFLEIFLLVKYVIEKSFPKNKDPLDLETILARDREARDYTKEIIRLGVANADI